MSADTQDRDVLYRMGVEAHPATRGVLQDLQKQSDATQAAMTKMARKVGDEVIREIDRITSARQQALKGMGSATAVMSGGSAAEARQSAAVMAGLGSRGATATAGKQAAKGTGVTSVARGSTTGEARQSAAEQAGLGGRTSAATATKESVDRFRFAESAKTEATKKGSSDRAAVRKKALADEAAIQEQSVDFTKRAEDAKLAVQKRLQELQAKAAKTQAEAQYKLKLKIGKRVSKYQETESKKAAQLHDLEMRRAEQTSTQAAADYETTKARFVGLREQSKQYKAAAVEAFSSGAESLMRMSRGFAALGLVGEENTEKFLRSLIKLQATFDLAVGGVNLVMRTMKGLDALEKMLKVSRAASAASASVAVAGSRAEAAALALEAKAANTAALAHGNLNVARLGGTVGAGGKLGHRSHWGSSDRGRRQDVGRWRRCSSRRGGSRRDRRRSCGRNRRRGCRYHIGRQYR